MSRAFWPAARIFVLAVVLSLTTGALASAQLPESFENLQVLPKDIEQRALIDTMRGFSSGLGVRCQHCHVGEEGQPLTTFDFVSDDKEPKRIAREMMRMTQAINATHLPRTGRDADGLLQVSCITCHRSRTRPESLEDNLSREFANGGAEAAVAAYRELRDRYYGRQAFDFGDASLVRLAERVASNDPEAALTFLELNLEHYPDSVRTLLTIGMLESGRGNIEAAIAVYRKALEAEPEARHVQRMLEAAEKQLAESSDSP